MQKNLLFRITSIAMLGLFAIFVLSTACQNSMNGRVENSMNGSVERGKGAAVRRGNQPDPVMSNGESYYFDTFGVSDVYVFDENKGFSGQAGKYFLNQAKGVHYQVVGEIQTSIDLSITHTYVIGFRAPANSFNVTIVRGVGNTNPTSSVVYERVFLPQGTEVKFNLTPTTIGPLLYDVDGDQTFKCTVAPSSP